MYDTLMQGEQLLTYIDSL